MPLYGIPHIPFLVIMSGINILDGTISNDRNSKHEFLTTLVCALYRIWDFEFCICLEFRI